MIAYVVVFDLFNHKYVFAGDNPQELSSAAHQKIEVIIKSANEQVENVKIFFGQKQIQNF